MPRALSERRSTAWLKEVSALLQDCLLTLQRARFLQSAGMALETAELLEQRAVRGLQRVAALAPLHTKQANDMHRCGACSTTAPC